jgi:hypothetical protein
MALFPNICSIIFSYKTTGENYTIRIAEFSVFEL